MTGPMLAASAALEAAAPGVMFATERRHGLPAWTLAAVASKETDSDLAYLDGTLAHHDGHGYGMFGCDDRSHTIPRPFPFTTQADMAARQLANDLAWFAQQSRPLTPLWWAYGSYHSGRTGSLGAAAVEAAKYADDVTARHAALIAGGGPTVALIVPWAVWRPLPASHGGPMAQDRGLVEHITTDEGDPWQYFSNPANQASSHFILHRDGLLVQAIDLLLASWAESGGNYSWASCEVVGKEFTPKTPAQTETLARLWAWGHTEPLLLWPLTLAEDPNGRGLGWHGMGGVDWGGHPNCPGDARRAQRPQVLARALQLVGQPEVDMPLNDADKAWIMQAVTDSTAKVLRTEGVSGANDLTRIGQTVTSVLRSEGVSGAADQVHSGVGQALAAQMTAGTTAMRAAVSEGTVATESAMAAGAAHADAALAAALLTLGSAAGKGLDPQALAASIADLLAPDIALHVLDALAAKLTAQPKL